MDLLDNWCKVSVISKSALYARRVMLWWCPLPSFKNTCLNNDPYLGLEKLKSAHAADWRLHNIVSSVQNWLSEHVAWIEYHETKLNANLRECVSLPQSWPSRVVGGAPFPHLCHHSAGHPPTPPDTPGWIPFCSFLLTSCGLEPQTAFSCNICFWRFWGRDVCGRILTFWSFLGHPSNSQKKTSSDC